MRIAVVGAGIAGLAMGLALDRAGLPCQIYEQVTELREVGAGLQIAPNATRLLHRFGLADRLKETAVGPEFLELRRWDTGAVLGRTVLGDECELLFGEPYYLVHRADLQRAMIGLPEGGVRLAARCEEVRETGDEVRVEFASAPADDWRTESCLAEGSIADLARAYEEWDEAVLRVVRAADHVTRWALHERDQQRQRDASLTNMLDLRSSAWLYSYDAEEAAAV